jgi:hypothetical protein
MVLGYPCGAVWSNNTASRGVDQTLPAAPAFSPCLWTAANALSCRRSDRQASSTI